VVDESCPTKIFLPNPSAPETAELYQRLGVNERELQIIATSEKKRHYYYTSSEGRRLYEVAPGPFAKAFIAKSDKDSLKAIRELEELHGDAWVDVWLRRHNLPPLERVAA
jgi:type IV secretory pathway VirB4 component